MIPMCGGCGGIGGSGAGGGAGARGTAPDTHRPFAFRGEDAVLSQHIPVPWFSVYAPQVTSASQAAQHWSASVELKLRITAQCGAVQSWLGSHPALAGWLQEPRLSDGRPAASSSSFWLIAASRLYEYSRQSLPTLTAQPLSLNLFETRRKGSGCTYSCIAPSCRADSTLRLEPRHSSEPAASRRPCP